MNLGPSRRSRSQSGFTLIEVLVVIAVIGILAAVAIPSMKAALQKSRHTSAYRGMKVLETGLLAYMMDRDNPPTTMHVQTLDPLVSGGYIKEPGRRAILSSLDRGRIHWYWGWAGGGWWDYDYGFGFRPLKDGPNVYCFLWPEGIWRWDGRWTQIM